MLVTVAGYSMVRAKIARDVAEAYADSILQAHREVDDGPLKNARSILDAVESPHHFPGLALRLTGVEYSSVEHELIGWIKWTP
jgi:hypothetical protein